MALDGYDAHRSTYSGGSTQLYVMIPNQKTIDTAKVAIKAVLDGEDPDIEKDASELASVKDTQEVKKAPTNYGTSSGSKVVKTEPEKEEEKEEKKEEEETCDGEMVDGVCVPKTEPECDGEMVDGICVPKTDPVDPNQPGGDTPTTPDPPVDPPNPPEEGTGSTFPKDDEETIIYGE